MPDPIIWPAGVLKPSDITLTKQAFTRSGGTSIGGVSRTIRTDRGWWRVAYRGVALPNAAARKMWNAIGVGLGGRSGLLAAATWQNDLASNAGAVLVSHSDGSSFSDTSLYSQPAIRIEMATEAARGATSVTLRIIDETIDELVGVRFSYLHALYETGFPTAVDGAEWTVPVFPAVRQTIPAGSLLEFDMPTCLVHLAADDAMEGGYGRGLFGRRDVDFIEATDYWADIED